jgi:hypothetical protein
MHRAAGCGHAAESGVVDYCILYWAGKGNECGCTDTSAQVFCGTPFTGRAPWPYFVWQRAPSPRASLFTPVFQKAPSLREVHTKAIWATLPASGRVARQRARVCRTLRLLQGVCVCVYMHTLCAYELRYTHRFGCQMRSSPTLLADAMRV